MTEDKKPVKEPSSGGISLNLNGQKISLGLQGGIFSFIGALVIKVWMVFNQMQVDVGNLLDNVDTMTTSIKNMDDRLGSAVTVTDKNAADIERMKTQVKELENKVSEAEKKIKSVCDATPKACQ